MPCDPHKPRCTKDERDEFHTCPFRVEISDDRETECTCCSECTYDCAMEV